MSTKKPEPINTSLTITVRASEAEWLRAEAVRLERSISWIIRDALRRAGVLPGV